MRSFLRCLTLLTVATVLVACGSTKMAVKSEDMAAIQTVTLIEVSEPPAYVAQDFGNPGAMFGALGGVAVGTSSASTGERITSIARNAGFSASQRLTSRLKQKLGEAGYQVKTVTVARDNNQKLLDSYADIATASDAIVDVALISVGYATEHPIFSPFWRPSSQVEIAMVSRAGQPVYREKFMYGYHNPLMSGTDIDAPESYRFKNKDELFADDARLLAGMEASVDAVVDQIAANLAR